MIKLTKEQEIYYRPEGNWAGRSLENYIALHPKAKGAKTLTQARGMAFGFKSKAAKRRSVAGK